jgi:hypothetical protein
LVNSSGRATAQRYAILLTSRQLFSVKLVELRCPEVKTVADTREPKAGYRSDFAPSETRTDRTRLAHWPPPFRSLETKPKPIKRPRGEVQKRATARGWRITRSMFSEFDEE